MAQIDYHTTVLPAWRIDQAFPLIQSAEANVSLENWHDYAKALLTTDVSTGNTPRHGIVIVERLGYIRGLFAYQKMPDLAHRQILRVEHFTVMEMVRRDAAARALILAATELASSLSCQAIQALLNGHALWSLPHFAPLAEIETLKSCYRQTPNYDRGCGNPS